MMVVLLQPTPSTPLAQKYRLVPSPRGLPTIFAPQRPHTTRPASGYLRGARLAPLGLLRRLRRSWLVWAGVRIAGQSADETMSPRCSTCPLTAPEVMMRRRTWADHFRPDALGTPRSLRSMQMENIDSPARARLAHSAMMAASSGTSWLWATLKP